jgi:hypothetical protein
MRVFKQYIYEDDDKKGYFRVTLVEIAPFVRAGATGKRSVNTGWASFFPFDEGL